LREKKSKDILMKQVGYHFENNKKPAPKGTAVKKLFLNPFYKPRRWQLF